MKDSTSTLLDFLDTISLEEQEIFVNGLPQQTPYQIEVYNRVKECHPWKKESLTVCFDRVMDSPPDDVSEERGIYQELMYQELMECLIEAYMDHIKCLRDDAKHTIDRVDSFLNTLTEGHRKSYQKLYNLFFDDMDWDGGYRNYMETKGDLDDLKRMAQDFINAGQPSNFLNLASIWDFIKASQMICRPEDIENIATIAEFRLGYPYLYETMRVWAWG